VQAPQIGTLDWLPAAEHTELQAPPVAAAVIDRQVPSFVAAIDPDLADTAAFCTAYEVGLDVSANCVVVAGRRGETSQMAACLVLATDRADVNKTVRRYLDLRKLSFAPMEEAVAQTGMEYGGITPIGLPGDWPILVDTAVAAQDWIVIGSGLRRSKIALPGPSVASLPGVTVLSLALPTP